MTPTEQIGAWLRERRRIAERATEGATEWFADLDGEHSSVRIDYDPYATNEGIADCSVAVASSMNVVDALAVEDARISQPKLLAALERAVEALEQLNRGCLPDGDSVNTPTGIYAEDTLSDIASLLGGSP